MKFFFYLLIKCLNYCSFVELVRKKSNIIKNLKKKVLWLIGESGKINEIVYLFCWFKSY